MKKLSFRPGQFVFKSGEKSTEIFLLVEGEIGIFLPYNETKIPDHKIGVSEIFGEMGLIDGFPRSASVIALEDCTISIITQDSFNNLAQHKPEALMPILKVLAKRLRSTLTLVEDLQKGKSPSA